MAQREELERRVEELAAEVARLKGVRPRGVRWRSALTFGNLPFVSVALGPDFERGERRGHAKGVIAIGDLATGLIAVGGLARGGLCFGGVTLGLVSFGGLALGALLAIGGCAVGGLALGGAGVGGVAVGGAAIGYYACGGAALGPHPVSALEIDEEGARFFAERGLTAVCPALLLPRR
jgi:hypothetical protein